MLKITTAVLLVIQTCMPAVVLAGKPDVQVTFETKESTEYVAPKPEHFAKRNLVPTPKTQLVTGLLAPDKSPAEVTEREEENGEEKVNPEVGTVDGGDKSGTEPLEQRGKSVPTHATSDRRVKNGGEPARTEKRRKEEGSAGEEKRIILVEQASRRDTLSVLPPSSQGVSSGQEVARYGNERTPRPQPECTTSSPDRQNTLEGVTTGQHKQESGKSSAEEIKSAVYKKRAIVPYAMLSIVCSWN